MHLSILDLAHVPEGSDVAEALRRSRDLARHAEACGYHRFWMAEHHNMVGIASAATAVALGYVAAGTRTIRIGAGGVMLPNHSPLVIAEQFGTLEVLYPGRVDLGLGRAPGTDQRTLRALRRDPEAADTFPQDVVELQALLAPVEPGQVVRAVPGAGLEVPLYILGSSLFGAQLAAMLGLPYAFAAHFAPDALAAALAIYRERYQPSPKHPAPHAIVAVNVVAASTDAEAQRLHTSQQQAFLGMIRGNRGLLPPPVDDMESLWSATEKAHVSRMLARSFVGAPATLRRTLADFLDEIGPDEVMVASAIHDHDARLESYRLLADVWRGLDKPRALAS